MGTVTYSNEKVVKFVDFTFVPVQIETSHKDLVEQFKVTWTPTVILLDADGNEKYRTVGYLAPDDFIATYMVAKGHWSFEAVQYPEAQAMFEEALAKYPNSLAASEAVFFLGVTRYRHTHEPKHLREAYEILTARFPQSEWAKRADPYRQIPQS
jgi:TolA-binding protein